MSFSPMLLSLSLSLITDVFVAEVDAADVLVASVVVVKDVVSVSFLCPCS